MKKNILYIAAIAFLLTGCSKQLDTKPTSSLDAKDALKTSSDVVGALKGAYSDLGSSSFYGGDLFVEEELLGDNNDIDFFGTYQDLTQIHNKAIPVSNAFISSTWIAGYRVINDVNVVLDSINLVVEADRAQVAAEAKFLRGCAYFDLVRAFAKAWNDGDPASNPGVPIVLKSTDPTQDLPESAKVSRNPVAVVYTQVIKDLTEAAADLPGENGFYANQAAAYGMLARVYLQQQNYAKAAEFANKAIITAEDNGFRLTETFSDAFPFIDPPAAVPNTTEDIFALQVNATSGANSFQTYYSEYGRGDIETTDDYFNIFDDGDDERYNFFDGYYTLKFDNVYGNVHNMRLAEMYLIRAEANFRESTEVGDSPLNDINLIRARSGAYDYEDSDITLDNILLERQRELSFEGFRLNDIKRLETNITGFNWNSPKLIFPIPKRELQINANLTQNEGYQ